MIAREEGLIFSLCTSMHENKLVCGKACLSKHFMGSILFFSGLVIYDMSCLMSAIILLFQFC